MLVSGIFDFKEFVFVLKFLSLVRYSMNNMLIRSSDDQLKFYVARNQFINAPFHMKIMSEFKKSQVKKKNHLFQISCDNCSDMS